MMTDTSPIKYSLYIAVAFLGIYILNLIYLKIVRIDLISPVQSFPGLSNIQQTIILLIMSIFFVTFVVHKKQTQSA